MRRYPNALRQRLQRFVKSGFIGEMKPFFLGLSTLILLISGIVSAGDFSVGAAKSDITPPMGVPLDGAISQNGEVSAIHDRIHVRALVFSNGKTKVVLATVDNTMVSDSIFDGAKKLIEAETGIPGSHCILAATHTHSTPRAAVGLIENEAFDAYLDSLSRGIADAVVSANQNLQPALAGWSSFSATEHVHNRRWFVEGIEEKPNPFGKTGEVVGMNPGRAGLIKPAGPVDPELFLLSVQSREGKPLAVMGNYGLHYVGGISRGNVSADYFGVFSRAIAKEIGAGPEFLGLMSNGTSGDVNAVDYTAPRQKYEPFENMRRIGEDLAKRAAPVVKRIDHQPRETIAAAETVLDLRVRKPDADLLQWAKENAAPPNYKLRLTRPQVYARENLKLAEYPDTAKVRIQAVRIGELAVVGIPCEVFAETGLAIKAAKVFPATIVMELANGYHGYLPTAEQHTWGGYETWPARSSNLEVEAETKIRAAAIELLGELKK